METFLSKCMALPLHRIIYRERYPPLNAMRVLPHADRWGGYEKYGEKNVR
jgi:hypothetical protein